METRQIQIQRFSVTSSKAFEDVVAKLDAAIGHPDMRVFGKEVSQAKSYADLEQVVRKVIGPSSELMEFFRIDLGEVLRKEKRQRRA